MQSKSQQFSEAVFERVSSYVNDSTKDKEMKKKYKSLCKRSGGVLRTVGLIQFLTFLKAKGQKPSEEQHNYLLGHLQDELYHFGIVNATNIENMLLKIRTQSLPNYMYTTKEVLKLLQWHKRMADILIQGNADESGDN